MSEVRKILIVDDEQDIRNVCAAIIDRYFDLQIFCAGSITEAKSIAQQEQPDYAILDLHLPDGVGFDLVPFLKAANDKLRFLIVTAYNHCVEKSKAADLGAEKLLAKPFKSKDLKMEVEQMMGNVNG